MHAHGGLPTRYRLRRPHLGDASAIDRLAAASDAALAAPPTLDEDLIRRLWARPRFALEADAWIVELGDTVVGYAQVWAEAPTHLSGFALVHPDHTGRGIGSALAALIEDRAAEHAQGQARLLSAATPQDEAAARLLADRGYAWVRRFWQMEVELDDARQGAVAPPGIRLDALDPVRDLPAAHRILEEAFADHWDYTPTEYEEFLAQNVHQDDFDPGLWIVASEAGEPVAVLCGSARADRGIVEMLGVLRSHRGRGIASALLGDAFAEFARRGLARARLNVDSDNPTGAVSLYERMGMRVVSSYDLWSRIIEPGGPDG